MNICFLCKTFQTLRGGIESYTYHMAKALSGHGHTVYIITKDSKGNYNKESLGSSIFVHRISINEEPLPGFWRIDRIFPIMNLRYSIAIAKKVREISKTNKIDVIETPDWLTEGFWLSVIKKYPIVLRLHGYSGLFLRYSRKTLRNKLYKNLVWHMERYLIHHVDGISAVSKNFVTFAEQIWEFKNKDICVIPNSVDTQLFKPSPTISREKAVLFVGRLEENKGIGVLENAIPEVLQSFPDVRFYFAGFDTKRSDNQGTWKEHILKQKISRNLVFLGQLETSDLVRYYQKCLICVFPSLFEAGGIVNLEAMASGCAVIASGVGGYAEAIINEEDGILIKPGDSSALSQAIVLLLRNEKLTNKLSLNASKKISAMYEINKNTQDTLKFYEQVIKQHFMNSQKRE